MQEQGFTKYEIARILGARSLQIAMNAPLLIKMSDEELERLRYDVLKIAEIEFNSGVLPISVKKPFPEKKEKEISEEGEIMALANPEDEAEEEGTNDEE